MTHLSDSTPPVAPPRGRTAQAASFFALELEHQHWSEGGREREIIASEIKKTKHCIREKAAAKLSCEEEEEEGRKE